MEPSVGIPPLWGELSDAGAGDLAMLVGSLLEVAPAEVLHALGPAYRFVFELTAAGRMDDARVAVAFSDSMPTASGDALERARAWLDAVATIPWRQSADDLVAGCRAVVFGAIARHRTALTEPVVEELRAAYARAAVALPNSLGGVLLPDEEAAYRLLVEPNGVDGWTDFARQKAITGVAVDRRAGALTLDIPWTGGEGVRLWVVRSVDGRLERAALRVAVDRRRSRLRAVLHGRQIPADGVWQLYGAVVQTGGVEESAQPVRVGKAPPKTVLGRLNRLTMRGSGKREEPLLIVKRLSLTRRVRRKIRTLRGG